MKRFLNSLCPADLFFAFSLVLFILFGLWLYQKSDDEKVHDIFQEYEHLVMYGKKEQAKKLFQSALQNTESGPLDPVWLPFVRAHANGYDQLNYHIRMLEAVPEREDIYEAIANLIEFAPEAFHLEVKKDYYDDLKNVKGVRIDMLEKYDLLNSN